MKIISLTCCLALFLLALLPPDTSGAALEKLRSTEGERLFKPMPNETPNYEMCTHHYNNIRLPITNMGLFGNNGDRWVDCETGGSVLSGEYPIGSQVEHLHTAALWIGAVVGDDTLVSVGSDCWQRANELWPCADAGDPDCILNRWSNRPSDVYLHPDAVADQEYHCRYSDTLTHLRWINPDSHIHTALGVEITQASYGWSTIHAQDFIIIDYSIENIGDDHLSEIYVGLVVDGDVGHTSHDDDRYLDDICGFKVAVPSPVGVGLSDTINIAWIADNDGDPADDLYDHTSARSIAGVRALRWPEDITKISFNWWVSSATPILDWGPTLEGSRIFGTGGLGTPEGDKNKYYIMSNGEHDYDQIYSAVDYTDNGWLPPPPIAAAIASGGDAHCLVSGGPFDLAPGESESFTIAYIAGEAFHRDPMNHAMHMQTMDQDPYGFASNLSFDDIGLNAVMAARVFDNPGIDTDGDGDAGPFWVLVDTVDGEEIVDTFYYAGDGVPDLRALSRLPVPRLRFAATENEVTIRWNGLDCETFRDPLTMKNCFEGYSVYFGGRRDTSSMSLICSNDLYDFAVMRWNRGIGEFRLIGYPLTLFELREMYGGEFDPLDYPYSYGGAGFEYDGEVYCFIPVGHNQSIAGWNDGGPFEIHTDIRKRFIDEIDDSLVHPAIDTLNPDLWIEEPDPVTGEMVRYHKFFEYEFTVDKLLSTVPYYFGVSVLGFGDVLVDFSPISSSPMENAVEVWAMNYADDVASRGLDVVTYPNPYYGRYATKIGGRASKGDDIVFKNLPAECTIRIFTISGDLVREIEHPSIYSDTDSQLRWNLLNKENRRVKSGIFLYSVESEQGNQIGKIVIVL